jgi:putative ABC transport system permease protein
VSDRLPRGVLLLLRRMLPGDLVEPIAGDLVEEYLRARDRRGALRARSWVWSQAIRLGITFRWERAAHGRPLPPIGDEVRGAGYMWDSLRQDVIFGARMLRRQPGFTVVALFALALGIGANTAIFSIVDAVLWRPLPYPGSDRIVSIGEQRLKEGRGHGPVAPADFYDWRRDNRSFAAMAIVDDAWMNLSGDGEPERLSAIVASPGFLSVLGIAPSLGRDMRAEEEVAGNERVVLLTDGFWRRRFGSDPAIVGRTVTLNDKAVTVVGVLPPSFWWPERADIIVPFAALDSVTSVRGLHYARAVARLNAGVTLERAQADLDAVGTRLAERYPDENTGHMPHATRLQDDLVRGVRPAMLVLLGAVGLVLLIACANVATLLLARATGRQREVAVRVALGAGRPRLVRQLLTENVLLAFLGGAAGLLIASWSIAVFQSLLPAEFRSLPGIASVGIDSRVLGAALLVTTATGLVFGAVPAIAASDVRIGAALSEEGRGGGSGARSWRVRAALIVVEMALSVVLLVGAGLLIVSFKHLLDVSPGFEPQHLVATTIALPVSKYDTHARTTGFYQTLLERARAMPGVVSAGVVAGLPFNGQDARLGLGIQGRTIQSPVPVRAHPRLVSAGYLATLGVPLVRGRALTERDADGAPDVVLINSEAVRRYWPGEDPIGHHISIGNPTNPRWMEIVGIVGDIKHNGLDVESEPEIYLPYLQTNLMQMGRTMGFTLVVRTPSDPGAIAPMLTAAVAEIDRDQPLGTLLTMDRLIADSVAPRRLNLWLVSAFALLALVLTSAGLYGVMSYLVAQRTHEIGVRMALGASRGSVLAMMLRQIGMLTLGGIAVGIGGALGLTRWLASLLFGVSARDPLVYVGVSAVLALVAVAAVAVPSSRATRVDPLLALREP